MLLIGFALLVIIVLRATIYDTLQKWGFTISSVNLPVDENLPNFFHAVKLSDADYMVYENKNLRKNYGFNMIPMHVEQRLDNKQNSNKSIKGVAWYNLLSNPLYAKAFNYIEVNVPSREDLIVDGDDNEDNDCEQSDMV